MHARTTLYAFRYTLPRVLRLVLAYPGRVQIEFKVAEIAIEIFTRTAPDDYTTICSLNLPPPLPLLHPFLPAFFSAAANRYLIARERCSHSPDASRKH